MAENFGLARRRQPGLPDKPKPVKPELPFNLPIPCDNDSFCERAKFEVLIPKGLISLSLYFCGHHFRLHEIELRIRGYEIRPVG